MDEGAAQTRAELAWLALEEGDTARALEVLRRAERAGESPPEAGVISALCHLELGAFDQVEGALARAGLDLPGDHPDLLYAGAEWALTNWRLEEAGELYQRLFDLDPEFARAAERLALVCDLLDQPDEADRWQALAAELEPDLVPVPHHLSATAFERIVEDAVADLPPEFRLALERFPVLIEPVPRRDLASRAPWDTPGDVLGLFVGYSDLERSNDGSGGPPAAIFLFQRNLERSTFDGEELAEEIRVTLYHELGHALGFDEHGVDEMGLA